MAGYKISGAFLAITVLVDEADRPAAAEVNKEYKQPFLDTIKGAESKVLLVREEDVQVLHGFATVEDAEAYLASDLFNKDVVTGLAPLLQADPDVRVYQAN